MAWRLLAAGALALLCACGQKGALQQPDEHRAVVTTPATAATAIPDGEDRAQPGASDGRQEKSSRPRQ
ncbi:MAG: lipoprotein [Steroidobacteraceae bacterium]